jgi:hypothetical protein
MKCNRCKLVNPVNTEICKRCYTPLSNQSRVSNESQGGIYHDNNLLVIEIRASLPNRCYKCNSPHTVDNEKQQLEYIPYLQKRLHWAAKKITPAAGLLPLTPGRRAMNLNLHTCVKHRSKRPLLFTIGVIALVSSVLALFLSARILSNYNELLSYLTIAMGVLFTVGLIILVGVSYLEPVKLEKYRDSYFWVSGFGKEYLKSFPNLADAQNRS